MKKISTFLKWVYDSEGDSMNFPEKRTYIFIAVELRVFASLNDGVCDDPRGARQNEPVTPKVPR